MALGGQKVDRDVWTVHSGNNVSDILTIHRIFHLDKVETPILIYCGEGYNGVDYARSGELFSGLRRLKKNATFVWYRGESHLHVRWRPEHRADYWKRIIDWFEKYLN